MSVGSGDVRIVVRVVLFGDGGLLLGLTVRLSFYHIGVGPARRSEVIRSLRR